MVRQSVLIELGRFSVACGRETARNFAEALMEHVRDGNVTTTKESAQMLRESRVRTLPRADL